MAVKNTLRLAGKGAGGRSIFLRLRSVALIKLARNLFVIKAKTADAGTRSDKRRKVCATGFHQSPSGVGFLQLRDVFQCTEAQMEVALLDHRQEFLLEFGKGFHFVALPSHR